MAGSPHAFREVRASGPGLVERPPGHRLVHPVGLVHDLREGGEIVRGNAVALAAVAVVEAIVPLLDDGKTIPAPDQQMCPFFVDDDHVHLIAPSWLSSTAIDLPCWLEAVMNQVPVVRRLDWRCC